MPYSKKTNPHKQCRILLSEDDYDELVFFAEAEERSVTYVASRLIREALAMRSQRKIKPVKPKSK